MKLFRILLLVALTAAMSACSSHRKAAVAERVPRKPAMAVGEVAALASTYSQWETLNVPFSFRCSRPMSLSASGRATMVRDKWIYLSMRMLGFEIASVYVSSDSCIVADKYHKTLITEPLDALTARTGLTVGDLQDILLGRAFYPGSGTLCDIDAPQVLFSPGEAGEFTTLTPRRLPAGAEWYFTIDSSPVLRAISVEAEGHAPVTAVYEGAYGTPAGIASAQLTIEAESADRAIEATVQWDLAKAKWNETVSEPSLSFKGYKRLSGRDALRTF